MTTWQQDQIDHPKAIDDFVVMGLLEQVNNPTLFVGAGLELAMAPFYMSNPDFDARTFPPNAVETLQASMNRYERKTGKTEWVDRFWKRAKPWRVTIRRIDEVQA